MSVAARRSAEKEAFWRLVLEEHRASGQSIRAFCTQKSISEASFFAWRKELERRDQASGEVGREGSRSDRSGDDQRPAMIPVNVVAKRPARKLVFIHDDLLRKWPRSTRSGRD